MATQFDKMIDRRNFKRELTVGAEFVGRYGFAKLNKSEAVPHDVIPFNLAKSENAPENKWVHFFIDDYQFERVWNFPKRYIDMFKRFEGVFTPDFSMYADFPLAVQIYNHYRKHALGAYWQNLGLTVIPTICWSDEESFEWCFDGEPIGGTVAVSSIGTQNSEETKQAFLLGYNEMMKRLEPEAVIFYGSVPNECHGNIVRIDNYSNKFMQKRINKSTGD